MPRTKSITIYQYAELPTKQAKEKAREWLRDCEAQDFNPDYESYETAAELLGIEFDQRSFQTMGGKTHYEADIRYDLSYCQGSGASFVGTYTATPNCAKKIRAEFPQDKALHKIADGLSLLLFNRRLNGLHGITAKIAQDDHHYCHKYTMSLESVVAGDNEDEEITEDEQQTLLELMRDFAQWIYDGLRADYEYRMSDESLIETIEANEYEFYADGERAA